MSDNMYDPYCFKSKQSSPLPIIILLIMHIMLQKMLRTYYLSHWPVYTTDCLQCFFSWKLRRDRVRVLTKEKIGTRRGREKGVASTRSPNPFSSVSPLAFCINVFEGINTHQTPREMPGYKQSCIQLPRVINISCILLHLLSAVYDRNQEKYMALR